jgi:hypothetical protein
VPLLKEGRKNNIVRLRFNMKGDKYQLQDINGNQVDVFVRRDKRLKKSSRWERQVDGSILLRIPYRLPRRQIGNLLDQVALQLMSRKVMAEKRTDAELQLRAEAINKRYFKSKIQWHAIRWVGNMEKRLGSSTSWFTDCTMITARHFGIRSPRDIRLPSGLAALLRESASWKTHTLRKQNDDEPKRATRYLQIRFL